MSLTTYRRKRDFAATAEPEGTEARGAGDAFVVQKHAARNLHYDFRLEIGGALASWAVPKGPSLVPGEKRLAVRVEDHPLDYAGFEGTIAPGQYGAGEVIVWDRGRWKSEGDPAAGLRKGHLDFTLEGEKLRGRWHLARMAGKPGETRENWLLIKADDARARGPGDPDILTEAPRSVLSGREVGKARARTRSGGGAARGGRDPGLDPGADPGADPGRDPWPGFIPPALATLRPKPPAGEAWAHEIKFDGYRLQARIRAGEARLLTRGGQDWTDRLGSPLPEALSRLDARAAILDGELVVEGPAGASDFGALQADLAEGRGDRFLYYLFDLLHLDGVDLRPLPFLERKARLAALIAGSGDPLRLSEHFDEDGARMLSHACRLGLEGLVSKRRDGAYPAGRTKDWIKSKCAARREFVIAGYVPSAASPAFVGSLVLGQYEEGGLVAVGRVGTGFGRAAAEDLTRRLAPLRRETPPFAAKPGAKAARGVVWVRPSLVAEVAFSAWTADGLLRHASFRGLREDKPAREVVAEGDGGEGTVTAKSRPRVKLTHPDRLYWPGSGVTKQMLAEYYTAVWPRMAPLVMRRPLALLRCPEGIEGQCFFQKHAWKGQGRRILTFRDPEDDPEEAPLVAIDGLPGLIALVQGAALEIHAWQATLDDLAHPDQIVMDLDPGDGVPWEAVIAAARTIRDRLGEVGLAAFVKTSGGKGLHVVAPLAPTAGWREVKRFAEAMAKEMARAEPDRYVATVSKAKRTGRILIDYLRNGRGATAVAAYGARARPGAPVSMPLAWEELGPEIGPAAFTVRNAAARLADTPDPWSGFRAAAKPLPEGAEPGA